MSNALRFPQLRLLAAGQPVPGVLDAEVTSNNHFAADCYTARIALGADRAALATWAQATDTLVELQIGLDGVWASLVTGMIDTLVADPVGNLLTIEGRDLSAALIEARTAESFANQTASDIATLLAGRHGLTPVVTATSTPVGRYYSADHTRTTLHRQSRAGTEWELLAGLAQIEGFDLFVAGTSLYFQPAALDAIPALVLQPVGDASAPANVTALRLQRRMTLAGEIDVTVQSWNSQQQQMFSQTATRAGGAPYQRYSYTRPNLSSAAAMALAQQKLASLTSHEFVLTATMPGELQLAPRNTVLLAGTGSLFDQAYVVDAISRRIDAREGFVQTVRARAASPADTAGSL